MTSSQTRPRRVALREGWRRYVWAHLYYRAAHDMTRQQAIRPAWRSTAALYRRVRSGEAIL